MASDAAEWQWSSFQSTTGEIAAPPWLAASEVLSHFSNDTRKALSAFRAFVDAGVSADSPWMALSQEIYLGDEAFVERIQALMLDDRRCDVEIPRAQRRQQTQSLSEVFVNADSVAAGVTTAYRTGRFTMRQIAEQLGIHYCTVSRMIARSEMLDCKT